ncbi:MAG: NAD(+)/NADH kinase [Halovenus sp.]
MPTGESVAPVIPGRPATAPVRPLAGRTDTYKATPTQGYQETSMRYFVTSNDERQEQRWERELGDRGFDVATDYDTETIIVTLGGDGSILHAARTYPEPTILPVRTGGSKGHRTTLERDQLVETLERIDTGSAGEAYTTTAHRKIAAYRDGTELAGEFRALNEISLHHSSAILAAIFTVRIRDRDEAFAFERVIGDGVLVATPFGSTGYYRSITDGTFTEGLGIAFNNVHTPVEIPSYAVLSRDAVVEVELVESDHASSAVLTRDNDEQMYELPVGEPVEIHATDETVEILQPTQSTP